MEHGPQMTWRRTMEDRLKMRAADTDRQQVVDRLGDALACGRLTMDEYVERMGHAYQAVTYGDLAPLCADLPARQGGARSMKAPAAGVAWRGMLAGLPAVLRVLWVKWLVAVLVNVVVWALVSSTSGHLAYPWPVWVAGPFGAVLLALSAGVTLFRRGQRPAAR